MPVVIPRAIRDAMKGVVLGGTASGVGKTVATLATSRALDHVELRARDDALTANAGDARFAFDVERGTGITDDQDGLTEYQTLGTYAHVHADSGAFDTFIQNL